MKFKLSLALNFLLLLFLVLFLKNDIAFLFFSSEKDSVKVKKHLSQKALLDKKMFFEKTTRTANIVFLGNSITSRMNWNDLLNRNDIINRGLAGDITEGFLGRIDNIINIEPKVCFIMGGINDLVLGLNMEQTASNIELISKKLIDKNIEPVIFSILYSSSNQEGFKKLNTKISLTNELIKSNCKKLSIEYIDLNEYLSENQVLISEYSADGIHLNLEGYYKWADVIRPIIDKKRLSDYKNE